MASWTCHELVSNLEYDNACMYNNVKRLLQIVLPHTHTTRYFTLAIATRICMHTRETALTTGHRRRCRRWRCTRIICISFSFRDVAVEPMHIYGIVCRILCARCSNSYYQFAEHFAHNELFDLITIIAFFSFAGSQHVARPNDLRSLAGRVCGTRLSVWEC